MKIQLTMPMQIRSMTTLSTDAELMCQNGDPEGRKIPSLRVSTFRRGLLIVVMGLVLLDSPASAANRTVTSLADSGAGTLREAISLVGIGETINFAVTGTIQLTSGELLISDHVTISGPGATNLTVARSAAPGTPPFRIFRVRSTAANPVAVFISGLTISHGAADTGGGGGLLFVGFPSALISFLTLDGCTFTDNRSGGPGGGLLMLDGIIALRNCAFIYNQAGVQSGGGLAIHRSDAVLENCTIARNLAADGAGLDLYASPGRVTGCTFAENSLSHVDDFGASCIKCSDGPAPAVLTLENTILQAATNRFVSSWWPALTGFGPQVVSHGYNLCNDDGVNLFTPGDRRNTDARLDSSGPRNNGGPTPTIALLDNSPALDKGKAFGLAADQRGQLRPRDSAFIANASGGDGSDIGAFEATEFFQAGHNLVVTTTDDHDDGVPGEFDCTLREAIRYAGAAVPRRVITFAANVTGTITLDPALGSLETAGSFIVAGPGARKLALSGEGGVRPILSFGGGSIIISGLTVRNGQRLGASVDGAGMVNLGTLTVADCAFVDNIATALSGSQPGQRGGEARGGAIFNAGTLTLNRCSFSGNRALGGSSRGSSAQLAFGPGGGSGLGAAVFNDTNGTLTADNCTFYSNFGRGGDGADNTGAGSRGGNGGRGFGTIFNQGAMTLTSCTLRLNLGTGGAGGLNDGAPGPGGGGPATSGGASTVRNTISADNSGASGPDASGPFTSQGWNLLGKSNGSTGFTATGDQTGSSAAPLSAQAGLFQNNGGATDTFLLLAGSPAIDKGRRFGLGTDQRNLPRLYDTPGTPNASGGDGTDIGAVEMQPAYSGAPRVLSVTLIGPTARVVVQGTAAVNYQLQKTDTLTNSLGASFVNLGAPQTADSIGQTEFTDYGPRPFQRFYRAFEP